MKCCIHVERQLGWSGDAADASRGGVQSAGKCSKLRTLTLKQRSPACLAPGMGFMEDSVSMVQDRDVVVGGWF